MTLQAERVDEVVTALRGVLRDEQILTSKADRLNRARVPAPFPVHRWAERIPDLAVLPTSTEEVAAVVRIANDLRVPIVPRDGGTGLTDGAVPLRGGIVVDVKRMNAIKELDLDNRTVTVGTGINMLKLNEQLARHGLFYPDDPASYPCSLVGGRIGTSGWSLIGSRYGHTRDLVLSFDHVLPTGEIMHVGDGIGHKISKSSSGYQLKHLFMGHQGTLGIATQATLKLFPKPEAELSPFWAFDNYDDAYACVGALARAGVATFAGAVLFDEHKVAYLRRDDEAYIPQPADVRALVCAVMYGYADEVRPAGRRLFRIAREHGARYLGDEISEGDWACWETASSFRAGCRCWRLDTGASSPRRCRPESQPPASGLQGSTPRPYFCAVGSTSRSISRARREYGGCSVTGRSRLRFSATHWASTIWEGRNVEVPMYRILPW